MGVPEMPSPDGGAVDYGDGFAAVPVMDGRWIDETFAALAKEDPEAKVLVRMRLTTPDWWRRRHPGECVVTVDREGRGFERPWASPASKAWLAECDAAMRRTIRMVEAKWSHMTVGYHPGLAACAENSYDWATGVADFSHVQTNALGCAVPDPRAYFGGFGDVRRFLDVKTEMNAVAFMRRQSEVMGGAAVFLASVVKDELRRLGRKKICGVFYGYAALPVDGHSVQRPPCARLRPRFARHRLCRRPDRIRRAAGGRDVACAGPAGIHHRAWQALLGRGRHPLPSCVLCRRLRV